MEALKRSHGPLENPELVSGFRSATQSNDEVYAVYLRPPWATRHTELDLGAWPREYEVLWYETRRGGDLRKGSVERVSGPGPKALGDPPEGPERDWVVLVRRVPGAAKGTAGEGEVRP